MNDLIVNGEPNVKFTTAALSRAERELGMPFAAFVAASRGRPVSLTNLGILLRVGLEAGAGRPVSQDEAFNVIDIVGIPAVVRSFTAAMRSLRLRGTN